MARFEITENAVVDLEDIHSYISEDDEDAATNFLVQFIEKFQMLTLSPRAGRVWRPDWAELLIFPFKRYLIFYTQTDFGIEIIRVLHSAHDVEKLISKDTLP